MTDVPRVPGGRSPFRAGVLIAAMAALGLGVLNFPRGEARSEDSPPAADRRGPRTPRAIVSPDSLLLARAAARAAALPRLYSLLVSWNGAPVVEQYSRGARASTPANVKSVSKTIIGAVIGVAVARGDLAHVRQPIGELLVAETRDLEPSKRAITVEDLLTMRAGLQSTSFENYGSWVSSRNWVRDALRRPMVALAGTGGPMIYSTGSSHLLSAIIARRTGMSTHAYADRHLFRPMGLRLRGWTTDPQGVHFGGNEMRLTPREMLAFGELYLNEGRVTEGAGAPRQVIPTAWIDSSWVPRTSSRWSGNQYGYGWWITELRGFRTYFAWGYGGQYIFVVPALRAVVVVTSDPAVRSGAEGHRDEIFALLRDDILPALGA